MRTGGIPQSLQRGKRVPLAARIDALVTEMRQCIETAQALNFSAAAHREITEALRILAFEPPQPSPQRKPVLRVVYEDGSKPQTPGIPVQCLLEVQPPPQHGGLVLHVGTLSFRHLDYDDKLDLYLIRDRETRTLSNGEVHDLAQARMKELLSDSTLRRCNSSIRLFQTGLEPLIVGVYSALIEELVTRHERGFPSLVVQPVFFADGDAMASGRAWA